MKTTLPALLFWAAALLQTAFSQTPTSICMRPNQVRLVQNSSFQPKWFGEYAGGAEAAIASGITFTSSNPAVVAVSASGVFSSTGNLGEATVTAAWSGLSFSTKVKVVNDFASPNAEKRVVKVALIVIDPPIPAAGGLRFSEKFWPGNGGPMKLAQQTRDSIFSVTGGTVDYQYTEIHQESDLSLNRFGGNQLSVDSMYKLFLQPGWPTLHLVAEQTAGGSVFQYNDLFSKYNLCEKSNAHQIDEVWVWAMPFIGMYESNMTGTGAFWINGPVVTGNACTDLLPIMGFNYERYAGCALHNFTHRIELTMGKVFNTGYRYAPSDPPYPTGHPTNNYQLFQNYDAIETGQAHVGNGHYPPNGTSDYDYANTNTVPTRAPNWKRYPLLFDQTVPINCSAWGCEGDCGINYCSWWLRHLPHFKCRDQSGLLNNWWAYIIDYNEGKTLETATDGCNCQMFADDPVAYCASMGSFPWEDWIAGVKIGATEKLSGKSAYSDFTATAFNLDKNAPNNFTLTTGFSYFTYDEYWTIWVDLNHDGVFSSPDEIMTKQVLPHPANGSPTGAVSSSFSIPTSALTGPTRMRVSMKRGSYSTSCETFPFGEVEDYSVNISAGTVLPNIEVQNWTIQPHSHAPGETTNTNYSLLNSGAAAVAGSYLVGIFLSTDSGWGPNDLLVGSATFSNTPAGSNTAQNLAFTIPAATAVGNYFLILKADFVQQIAETNDLDNTIVVPFTVGFCSLTAQVSNQSCSGNYATATVTINGVNAGTGWVGSYSTPGGPSFLTGSYGVPQPVNVWKGTNNSAGVSVFDPNVSGCTVNFTIDCPGGGQPDLTSNAWEIIPANNTCYTNPGQAMAFFGGFAFNNGTAPAGAFTVKAYLSTDNILSANDILWQSISYPSLGITGSPGSPAGLNITAPVPIATPPGSYFAIVKTDADNQVAESNEGNNEFTAVLQIGPGGNCGGGQICASKSDFPWEDWIGGVKIGTVEKLSGKSAYSDFTATTFNLDKNAPNNFTLTTGFSYFTYDEYWTVWVDENHDGTFSSPDEVVTKQILPHPANGSPTGAVSSSFSIPASALNGPTRMRVSMKRGAFSTSCETLPFGEVEDFGVNIGTAAALPDLTSNAWEVIPANNSCYTNPGQAMAFFGGLAFNNGTATAGAFTAKAYLSTDNVLSANDLLWQTINYPSLNTTGGAGSPAGLNITAPVPASAAPGAYFAIVKIDADNQIAESNEANNEFVTALQIGPGGPCGGGSGADLELTLSADKTTPAIYSNVVLKYTVKNAGNQPVASAVIFTGICGNPNGSGFASNTGLVYAGAPAAPTVGSYNLVDQKWTIANLAPGQSGTLTITLFTLTGAERKVVAFSQSQSPADPDSQPGGMPANCTPAQDDEAVWTLNTGHSLEPGVDRADGAGSTDGYLLFPNPAGESVNVVMPNLVGKPVRLAVFDQLGLLVFEEKIGQLEFPAHALDLSGVRNGQYFLQILAENQRPVVLKLGVARLY